MKDSVGKELIIGQSVKELGHGNTKIKILSLEDPWICVQRDGEFTEGFAWPSDLTIVGTHKVQIMLEVRSLNEDSASSELSDWMNSIQNTIPKSVQTYKISVE